MDPTRARELGGVLRDGLASILGGTSRVSAIRGAGLFLGVELHDDAGSPDAALASGIVNDLRDRGVLISASGPNGNVLKIRSSLAFTAADAGRFLETFEASASTSNT